MSIVALVLLLVSVLAPLGSSGLDSGQLISPCTWETLSSYRYDRIPNKITEVMCLPDNVPCGPNRSYRVSQTKGIHLIESELLEERCGRCNRQASF